MCCYFLPCFYPLCYFFCSLFTNHISILSSYMSRQARSITAFVYLSLVKMFLMSFSFYDVIFYHSATLSGIFPKYFVFLQYKFYCRSYIASFLIILQRQIIFRPIFEINVYWWKIMLQQNIV